MARNGSGVYSLPPGSTVTNGDTSDATDVNTPLADLAADNNTARPVVAGGTGATSASAARTALGLAIGSNVQAWSTLLDSIAAGTVDATEFGYLDGVTSAIQTQIDAKAATADTYTQAEVDGLFSDRVYTSAAQTITTGGLVTLAHGLGAAPRFVNAILKCTTAEAGWAINDEVQANLNSSSEGTIQINTVYRDATNIYLRYSSNVSCFAIGNKATGARAILTNANWELIIEAGL